MRHLLALGFTLLLCVDGWGCAGAADDGPADLCPDEAHGWTCNDDCSSCTCDGAVTLDTETRGECNGNE